MPEQSWASSAATRKAMQGNRSRDTRPEVAVRRLLHARGLRYRVALRVPGTRSSIDIAFTRARVAVLIDGCFWHGCPEHHRLPASNSEYWTQKVARNRERDTSTTATLRAAGWTVVRFWEHQDAVAVADEIEAVVRAMGDGAAGRFTLDAFEAAGGSVPSWTAARFGGPWNGWATPVVERDVLAAVLDAVTAASGEPHRWEGDVAVISGPLDDTGEPEYEDRLEANPDGLYDLGLLGWTWVRLP